jgi:hypothetical protein
MEPSRQTATPGEIHSPWDLYLAKDQAVEGGPQRAFGQLKLLFGQLDLQAFPLGEQLFQAEIEVVIFLFGGDFFFTQGPQARQVFFCFLNGEAELQDVLIDNGDVLFRENRYSDATRLPLF